METLCSAKAGLLLRGGPGASPQPPRQAQEAALRPACGLRISPVGAPACFSSAALRGREREGVEENRVNGKPLPPTCVSLC